MLCPKCSNETNVTDSRSNGSTVKRRRQCVSCKERFTTFELHCKAEIHTHMKDLVILDKNIVSSVVQAALTSALSNALLGPLVDSEQLNGGAERDR